MYPTRKDDIMDKIKLADYITIYKDYCKQNKLKENKGKSFDKFYNWLKSILNY